MSPDFSAPSISRTGQPLSSAESLASIRADFLSSMQGTRVTIHGIDFSSAPRRGKPIMVASGVVSLARRKLEIQRLQPLDSLAQYAAWLASSGPCVIGFDLPFGLPRAFVESQGWPPDWSGCLARYASFSREALRIKFKAFCDGRPAGAKFAHRETDRHAGSSPSMKWVNPPVAWMLHAGAPPIVAAGLTIPGMHCADPARVATEAYPGMLARSVTKASYKSDNKAQQTPARLIERERILAALIGGETRPGVPTGLSAELADALLADASGDRLDSVLCLVQAAWGLLRDEQDFGLKPGFDSLEGWIIGSGLQ